MVSGIYPMSKNNVCQLIVIYRNFISAKSDIQKRVHLKYCVDDFCYRVHNRTAYKSLRIQSMTIMRTFIVIWVIRMFHFHTCESMNVKDKISGVVSGNDF